MGYCDPQKTMPIERLMAYLSKSIWNPALQPLKTHLHYHNGYGHQTWEGGNLHEGLPPLKSHHFLIMWSLKISWQT